MRREQPRGTPRPSWAGMPCRTTRSTRTIRRRDTPPASRQVCASPQPLTNAIRARGVLRAASFASLPHFASANNGPPSSCGDVLSCVLSDLRRTLPSPPSPLAGFHIQRKRSFDNLNMDSAEQDRCAMDASRHPQPPRSLPISRCLKIRSRFELKLVSPDRALRPRRVVRIRANPSKR